MNLPDTLQTLLEKSKTRFVNITLAVKPCEFVADTKSKVGGLGYLPQGETYPNDNGKPLSLLAQINFAEVASSVDLTQLPQPLPKSGILQFYVAGHDDVIGLDLNNYSQGDKYQVRFWQNTDSEMNVEELEQAKAYFLEKIQKDDYYLPFRLDKEYPMHFELQTQSVSLDCFELYPFVAQIDGMSEADIWSHIEEDLGVEDPDEILDAYMEATNTEGKHQLLGYPNFTQADPREYGNELKKHILLFQLETEYDEDKGIDIMWGDSGVGNFFIRPDDLKAQDFSQVLYNWDCG